MTVTTLLKFIRNLLLTYNLLISDRYNLAQIHTRKIGQEGWDLDRVTVTTLLKFIRNLLLTYNLLISGRYNLAQIHTLFQADIQIQKK